MTDQQASVGGGTVPRVGDISAATIQLAQAIEGTGERTKALTERLTALDIEIKTHSGEITKLNGVFASVQTTFDSQLRLLREANAQTRGSIESLVRDLGQLQQSYNASSQAVSTTTQALNDRVGLLNRQLDHFEKQLVQFPTMENIRDAMTDRTSPLAKQADTDEKFGTLSAEFAELKGSVDTLRNTLIAVLLSGLALVYRDAISGFLSHT